MCRRKPLIALLEPDTSGVHGGLTEAACREILRGERILSVNGPGASKTDPDAKTYAVRLQDQEEAVAQWAQAWDDAYQPVRLPTATEIENALFASAPIIWSPLTDLQDVTLRMVAERLIPGFTHNYGTPYKQTCLLYTSPSPRDRTRSRMPSSA